MSLQYIIDGCNLANNPVFSRVLKRGKDFRSSLIEVIINYRLCGSLKNNVLVVFDGYPAPGGYSWAAKNGNLKVVFSLDESADDKIKVLAQDARQPKNIVVVSNDKEIIFFVKSSGSRPLSVEEFAAPILARKDQESEDLSKIELNSIQKELINEEFKKLWLK